MSKSMKNTRVYVNDVEITDMVRSLRYENVDGQVELQLFSDDWVDLSEEIKQRGWLPKENEFDTDVDVPFFGEVTLRNGTSYTFTVFAVLESLAGKGVPWMNLYVDNVPPIPPGAMTSDGKPIQFVQYNGDDEDKE